MSEDFDPYHRWLGIPARDQPPNHYRLLGIERFEADLDVIRDAAEQRIAHVRTYQLGPHAAVSQRILNELGAARAALLDAERKVAYDAELQSLVQPPPIAPPPVRRRPAWLIPASTIAGVACVALLIAGVVIGTRSRRAAPAESPPASLASSSREPTKEPRTPKRKPPRTKPVAEITSPDPVPATPVPEQPMATSPAGSSEPAGEPSSPRLLQIKVQATVSRGASAKSNGLEFSLSLENARAGMGFAAVGYEFAALRHAPFTFHRVGAAMASKDDSLCGFVLDYHTPSGYTHRVAIGLGLGSEDRTSIKPHWGTGAKPDKCVDVPELSEGDLDLAAWAPGGWDGLVWVSPVLHHAGLGTSVTGQLTAPGVEGVRAAADRVTQADDAPETLDEPSPEPEPVPHARPKAATRTARSKPVKLVWTPLYNGRSLDGWEFVSPDRSHTWHVEGRELVSLAGPGSDLATERTFDDFELQLQFLLGPIANSGVFLRGLYEIQLFDHTAGKTPPSSCCGALYDQVGPASDAFNGPGRWNMLSVRLVGRNVTAFLNGRKILDGVEIQGPTQRSMRLKEDKPGPIVLQSLKGMVRFRNIRIREIH